MSANTTPKTNGSDFTRNHTGEMTPGEQTEAVVGADTLLIASAPGISTSGFHHIPEDSDKTHGGDTTLQPPFDQPPKVCDNSAREGACNNLTPARKNTLTFFLEMGLKFRLKGNGVFEVDADGFRVGTFKLVDRKNVEAVA